MPYILDGGLVSSSLPVKFRVKIVIVSFLVFACNLLVGGLFIIRVRNGARKTHMENSVLFQTSILKEENSTPVCGKFSDCQPN